MYNIITLITFTTRHEQREIKATMSIRYVVIKIHISKSQDQNEHASLISCNHCNEFIPMNNAQNFHIVRLP